jgi:uracil-DNA glycosylase
MSDFLKKIHSPVHTSWNDLLDDETLKEIDEIEEKIKSRGESFTPADPRVFHFMTNDLNDAKVVIIGQDPYPQEGVATGRAFEVSTLKDWNDTFRNVSLKNIVRAVYNACTGDFLTYNNIKQQLNGGLFGNGFSILPPDKLFKAGSGRVYCCLIPLLQQKSESRAVIRSYGQVLRVNC